MKAVFLLCSSLVSAAQLDLPGLNRDLVALTKGFHGRVGICVQSSAGTACVRPFDKFPMQSVMKLMVGFAVLDAGLKLDTEVTIERKDLALYVQPLEKLV